MGDFDVKELVIYDETLCWDGTREETNTTVLGIREFHVAKALLEGQQEPLEELVPSQWGPVHLFDLCLRFGHIDTAWALATGGVKGCTLEDHHLGALPDARDAEPQLWFHCLCEGWQTCSHCCWGFPVENGIWMKDWDENMGLAADAAKRAAKTPLVKGILDLASRNGTLSLAMSEAAAARLLDIAILCGDVQAATNLAKTDQARPLRRWRGHHLGIQDPGNGEVSRRISAALFAGADFQGLHMTPGGEVPLLRRIALDFEPEQWQQLEHFFPLEKNQWPTCDMFLGEIFREGDLDNYACVSMQRIQNAFKAGWDLKRVWIRFHLRGNAYIHNASLLDLAVLCGQPDCAVALGSAGVELKAACLDLHRRAFRTDTYGPRGVMDCVPALRFGSASECQSAASAAARASLTTSFKREGVEKGIALYQTLTKKFHPRGVPMALVRHILGFSMAAPKILDQLDLWGEVAGWVPSSVAAQGHDADIPADLNIEEQTGMDVDGVPGTPSAELPPESADLDVEKDTTSEPPEADVKTADHHDDLMTALQLSRDQVPVLSMDGVCVFRLTRMATSEHVSRVLLDTLGPFLWQLHRRVLEAGCEVDPEWNPVKALFVPITETQMAELQALSERGYELTKTDHILALQSDYDAISKALCLICCKSRPKLQQVRPFFKEREEKAGPSAGSPGPGDTPDQDEDMEGEPLLVLESGIRTDSDVGFPSYPTSSTVGPF